MEYKKAINHYDLTNQRLAKSNQLECIYKDNNRKLFNEKLNFLSKKDALQPLVASLSAHAAIRYEQEDTYPFCKNPMDLIHSIDLFEDERFNEVVKIYLNENFKLLNKLQNGNWIAVVLKG